MKWLQLRFQRSASPELASKLLQPVHTNLHPSSTLFFAAWSDDASQIQNLSAELFRPSCLESSQCLFLVLRMWSAKSSPDKKKCAGSHANLFSSSCYVQLTVAPSVCGERSDVVWVSNSGRWATDRIKSCRWRRLLCWVSLWEGAGRMESEMRASVGDSMLQVLRYSQRGQADLYRSQSVSLNQESKFLIMTISWFIKFSSATHFNNQPALFGEKSHS